MDFSIQITDTFLEKRPLSASSMKQFGGEEGSPRKYISYLTEDRIDKEAFVAGRATEYLIYENFDDRFKFDANFLAYDKFPRRSNADKERWEQMVSDASANNLTLIDSEMLKECRAMADTAMQTDETRYYLDRIAVSRTGRKRIQEKISFTDKKTNLPVIGYIDFIADIEGHLIIVDIKTDKSGGPGSFARNAASLDYHIQVGAYLTGYHKAHYQFPDFMFMVIDKSIPYDAIMMHCPADYCQNSKDEFDHILTAFRHCMDNNEFHRGRAFWSAEMGYFSMTMPGYKKMKFAK